MRGGHDVCAVLLAGKPVQADTVPVGHKGCLPPGVGDVLGALAPDGQVGVQVHERGALDERAVGGPTGEVLGVGLDLGS